MKTFINSLCVAALAFFTPLIPLIIVTSLMVIIRIITNYWAKKKTTLKDIIVTASYIAAYILFIMGAALIDHILHIQYEALNKIVTLSSLATLIICYKELKLIGKDIETITHVSFFSLFDKIVKKKFEQIEDTETKD